MNREQKNRIEKLNRTQTLSQNEFLELLNQRDEESGQFLATLAREKAIEQYGRNVYLRGLIEISNYCKNDCLYCGIRRSNSKAQRYRLAEKQILSCCETGYALGFRTFVLQGGEDPYFTDQRLCSIIQKIKKRYPTCAVTLSMGERSESSYRSLYHAGADRYLLRHETADPDHYKRLHPEEMSYYNRMCSLTTLRKIGFQTGCGFMVGSPGQTLETIVKDLQFIQEFQPHMIGIGPFIPHKDTPFANYPPGNASLTLFLLSVLRLMLPNVLLPATTALGTLALNGRTQGILAGANVIMPNLSPRDVRSKYMLYNDKISTGEEAAEGSLRLRQTIEKIGYKIAEGRGDSQIQFPIR